MDWQEFLKGESGIHELSTEQTETLLSALLYPEKAPLNQAQLSVKFSISEAAVKQRLEKIYKKFENIFPELSSQQGAGKLKILHTKLKQKYYQPSASLVVTQDSDSSPYPEEFRSLIEEKIRTFCGRQFVFDAFQQFITENPHGYFTIIGDAGMGKSSIAAKYASEHKSPCYFNILVERRNRPELFLKSIRRQLIDRYQLPNSEDADLPTLLAQVAAKLTGTERLVIAVDALDEVEQEAGGNLLHLPKNLPNNVYFLLTRRPYSLDKKRLLVDVREKELDLTMSEYVRSNQLDIKEYIDFALNNTDSEYKYELRNWIQYRSIADTSFVEQLADKSENNFMYLRYVLPAIAKGDYNDLSLKQLPDGLREYYQNHWERMGMEAKPGQLMKIVLYILLESDTSITCEIIAGIAEMEECEVEQVLEDEWVEYLKKQNIDGEICYTIYHASFLDFLKDKREMDSKRKIFDKVNQRIAEYLEKGMA